MTSMTSVSIEEKRLKLLKQQLFGKEQPIHLEPANPKSVQTLNATHLETRAGTTLIDPMSIRRDLIRIVMFSLLALAIQLSLFFASKQGFINIFR